MECTFKELVEWAKSEREILKTFVAPTLQNLSPEQLYTLQALFSDMIEDIAKRKEAERLKENIENHLVKIEDLR